MCDRHETIITPDSEKDLWTGAPGRAAWTRWGRVKFPAIAGPRSIAAALFPLIFALQGAHAEVSLMTLRKETRDLLRQEATLDEGREKDAAITALCDLYVVLRSDDRYAGSEMLQGDAAKIRRRLLTTARRRENRLKREQIEKPADLSSRVESAIASALAATSKEADDRTGAGGGQGGQAGGAIPDTGWQLVELIQRIVAPDFWEQQGGPGAIHYFAMRRVLVVRATTDVHEQIKDLLMALR